MFPDGTSHHSPKSHASHADRLDPASERPPPKHSPTFSSTWLLPRFQPMANRRSKIHQARPQRQGGLPAPGLRRVPRNPPDGRESPVFQAHDLDHLPSKYDLRSERFIRDPLSSRPGGRMPDLHRRKRKPMPSQHGCWKVSLLLRTGTRRHRISKQIRHSSPEAAPPLRL